MEGIQNRFEPGGKVKGIPFEGNPADNPGVQGTDLVGFDAGGHDFRARDPPAFGGYGSDGTVTGRDILPKGCDIVGVGEDTRRAHDGNAILREHRTLFGHGGTPIPPGDRKTQTFNQLRGRRQVIRPARRQMAGFRDFRRDVDKDRVDPLDLGTRRQLSEEENTADRWRRHEHLS